MVVPPGTVADVEARWIATRAAVDVAVGRSFVESVEAVGTLTLHIDAASGHVRATRADRVDEAGYRAAIEHALATLLGSSLDPPSGLLTALPSPTPIA